MRCVAFGVALVGWLVGLGIAHGQSPGAAGAPPGPAVPQPPAPGAPAALGQPLSGDRPAVPTLPAPRTVAPFGPGQVRLPQLACEVGVIGATPRSTPASIERAQRYVQGMVDAQHCLDLICGRTRLMLLKEVPARIQIADETVASYTLVSPKELSLLGKAVGTTVFTLWFADPKDATKQDILTYHVRVVPDPEAKERLERVYRALADEINRAFPDAHVCLQLVGDKLVLSGHVKDIAEATQILRIVRANAPNPFHSRPLAAQIPVDRARAVRVTEDGDLLVSPGVENYETGGDAFVVNLLRINGEQQVQLRVTVAEVNRAAARSIGLNFTLSDDQGRVYFAQNTGSIATGGLTFGPFGFGFGGLGFGSTNNLNTFGIPNVPGFVFGAGGFNNLPAALDNGQVRLAINALRGLDYARSLAEPTLVTMNGQTATFQAGGQFPVPIVTGYTAAGLQGVSFIPYGVQLQFTPYITDRDRIRLVVGAEVSSRDLAAGVTNFGGASVPSLITRTFNTTVELREGQTLAVAGLIQNNLGADSKRVPFFGDLPLVGRLAGFDRITAGEQELVVLITPELVHPLEAKELPPLPGSDLFEPTDLEFYLLGRLESRRPYDYRSPIRTDFGRLKHYRQCEQLYLSGPHGHGELP